MYIFMLVLMRIWGKKHLGEMTAFDLILLLFMSEAVQNSLIDNDRSIFGGMIVIVTLVFWNVVFDKIAYHRNKFEKLMDGEPKILIKEGKVMDDVMKAEQITAQELEEALRLGGVLGPDQVKQATIPIFSVCSHHILNEVNHVL
jgi:uncharacterized membrane protein YcaP (DUF421 family)